MNVVLVILDSLRKDHLGVYGNDRVRTCHRRIVERASADGCGHGRSRQGSNTLGDPPAGGALSRTRAREEAFAAGLVSGWFSDRRVWPYAHGQYCHLIPST